MHLPRGTVRSSPSERSQRALLHQPADVDHGPALTPPTVTPLRCGGQTVQRDACGVPVLDRGGQVGAARLASTVSGAPQKSPAALVSPVTPGPAGHDEGRIMISQVAAATLSLGLAAAALLGSDLPHAPGRSGRGARGHARTELTFAVQGCSGCHFRLTRRSTAAEGCGSRLSTPSGTARSPGPSRPGAPTASASPCSFRGTAEPATYRRSRSGNGGTRPAIVSRLCPHQRKRRVDLLGRHQDAVTLRDRRRARPSTNLRGPDPDPRAFTHDPAVEKPMERAYRGITGTQSEPHRG